MERFGRQPPSLQVPQGAAEGAAGRLGLRLGGLVVDGAVLHGRAAGCQLRESESKRAEAVAAGAGKEKEKGKGKATAILGPGGRKALPAAIALAPPGGVRGRAAGNGDRRAAARDGRAGVSSGLGLFSVL